MSEPLRGEYPAISRLEVVHLAKGHADEAASYATNNLWEPSRAHADLATAYATIAIAIRATHD